MMGGPAQSGANARGPWDSRFGLPRQFRGQVRASAALYHGNWFVVSPGSPDGNPQSVRR
jgi:hypothetical protein